MSQAAQAQGAIDQMAQHYPVPRTELQPRVFAWATENWLELTARFLVSVRTARSVKDEMTRRILARFEEAGIDVASSTSDVTVRLPEGLAVRADGRRGEPPEGRTRSSPPGERREPGAR